MFVDNSAAIEAAAAANAAASSAGAALSYIADLYSTSGTYNVGDYCIYDGHMYRCKTAIASPGESWTAAHWSEVQTMDEVEGVKSAIDTED